ncbi:hypothetical protein WS89_18190 [Burkholderia sp. MSMB1072]|uniref:DNA gyrase inhibitor YacG n=1 Tax=unclassified Burkholderia TaxID=2613784 RepID=UPI00075952AA|nr:MULTISPECIES: DNA gyrase inhibitor YacG [unclassified Burkholderia]KVD45470.1 hypothetical protein WS61_12970 [Burkholderia sp. ABCPW 11]KVH59517.1 hypothetical protein WS89_18190 [Burkholderia sp. MSMB1072]KVT05659.1 hypothetical protein WT24_20720 [Burkholderia sp. MSMB1078WGS]KWO43730.1 hypothetical protein WT97_16485 [Burkholderia sp. MSMB1459WGS]
MTTVVKCPSCGAEVRWTPENQFRPFCSARCKQLDLGAWAAEKYRIGGASDEGPSSEEDGADGRRDS